MKENLIQASGEPREPNDFIIVGLDVPTVAEARAIVKSLDGVCETFKVGKHFILDPEFSDFLHKDTFGPESTLRLMLDLKDYEIGASAEAYGAQVYNRADLYGFTVHAVRQTIEAVSRHKQIGPNLLAVLLLTSFGPAELKETYNWDVAFDGPVLDYVLGRAEMALSLGCEGVVCSPEEVLALREEFGDGFDIVVPGTRPLGYNTNDHKRVGTPAQAIHDGADYVVLARPIIQAPDPRDAFMRIADQIAEVIR